MNKKRIQFKMIKIVNDIYEYLLFNSNFLNYILFNCKLRIN